MGKKIYFPDKLFYSLKKEPLTADVQKVESIVKQSDSTGFGLCYILAPLYGLIRHNNEAFKKLITDDPEHNRITVHLYRNGRPYDIEMDRTVIVNSGTDFIKCSMDVNIVVKALLISGLANPGELSDRIFGNPEEAQKLKGVIKYDKNLGAGSPVTVMSAFGPAFKNFTDFAYQKELAEKANESIDDISDDILTKLDEWSKDKEKVVTLSVYTNTNHAVTLVGVNKEKRSITYYDQILGIENTVSLDVILRDGTKTNERNPRLNQILCFNVGKNSVRTSGYQMVDIAPIRRAVVNKKKTYTDEEVIDRIISKFNSIHDDAWKDFAEKNPDKMKDIVRDILDKNNLSPSRWNNAYKLNKMFDAVNREPAYEQEYDDRCALFDGIKKTLQSSPETSRTAEQLDIVNPGKLEMLDSFINVYAEDRKNNREITPRKLRIAYDELYLVFRRCGFNDIKETDTESRFPADTRSDKDFAEKVAIAKKWCDEFSKAFEKNNNLTADEFNKTEPGKSIKTEVCGKADEPQKEENADNTFIDDDEEINIPEKEKPRTVDDGTYMMKDDYLAFGYVKLLVANSADVHSTHKDLWQNVLDTTSILAEGGKFSSYYDQLQKAYCACREYLDKHTDNSNRQNDIGGQQTDGGRLRKAAVVNFLKTLETRREEQLVGYSDLHEIYEAKCRNAGREFIPLDFEKLENSLAEHADKKIKAETADMPVSSKAYAELNKKTKETLARITEKAKAEQRKKKQTEKKQKTVKKEAVKAEKKQKTIKN